jgi:hypothetical protein
MHRKDTGEYLGVPKKQGFTAVPKVSDSMHLYNPIFLSKFRKFNENQKLYWQKCPQSALMTSLHIHHKNAYQLLFLPP